MELLLAALTAARLSHEPSALREHADAVERSHHAGSFGANAARALAEHARAEAEHVADDLAEWWTLRAVRAERAPSHLATCAAGALRALAHALEVPRKVLKPPDDDDDGFWDGWDSIVPSSARWAFVGAESVEWTPTSRVGDEWRVAGLSLESAAEWVAWGFAAGDAVGWRCVSVPDPDDAAEWAAHGFSPTSAVAWRDTAFLAPDAARLKGAGFDHELATATREDLGLRDVVGELLTNVASGAEPPQRSACASLLNGGNDALRTGVELVIERFRRVGQRAKTQAALERLVGLLCARRRPREAEVILGALVNPPRVLQARIALVGTGTRGVEPALKLLTGVTGAEADLLRGVAALRRDEVESALHFIRAAQHQAEQSHEMRVFALARCHLGLALAHPGARRFASAGAAAALALADGVRLLRTDEAPVDLGIARLTLAQLALRRREGDGTARMDTAVDHLHAALAAFTGGEAPDERGRAHLMLGTLLQKQSALGRGETLSEAIAHLRAGMRLLRDPAERDEARRALETARREMEA